MSEEYFEVVNEHDEGMGCELREVVHRLGLRPRAVQVLIFKRQGRCFLQKCSRLKDCLPGTRPRIWSELYPSGAGPD